MVWHYTSNRDSHLGAILHSGVIYREGEAGRNVAHAVCPATWFSADPLYDRTAIKMVWRNGRTRQLSLEEMLLEAARIGISEDGLLTWAEYKMRGPVHYNLTARRRSEALAMFRAMEQERAIQGAKPADWFCTFERVPKSQWQSIQVFRDGQWVDYEN